MISLFAALISCEKTADKSPLTLQTDFGRKDNAVASMYGVALSVDKDLKFMILLMKYRLSTFGRLLKD